MTSWHQIKIWLQGSDAEPIEKFLHNFGAASVTLLDAEDQPVFQAEPGATPLWDKVLLIGLFPSNIDLTDVESLLRITFPSIQAIETGELADCDWERSWMGDFHAMQFGERLWICPSWESPPQPDAINIRLDPGLAFGSGTHATTSLCLHWLEQAELRNRRVIDYGCGSGILAIAAALLGAGQVIAVDNDPQALIATRNNREQNNIPAQQLEVYAPEQVPAHPAQVLLANILAEPLAQLAPTFARLLEPGGSLVLSGVLDAQVESLLDHYREWFDIVETASESGWARITATRN